MPPPDPREELKRQRALLEAQLAQLDAEAAAAASAPAQDPAAAGKEAIDPEQALRDFADTPENPADVKRGCLTIFVWGLALAAAALGAVYFAFYR